MVRPRNSNILKVLPGTGCVQSRHWNYNVTSRLASLQYLKVLKFRTVTSDSCSFWLHIFLSSRLVDFMTSWFLDFLNSWILDFLISWLLNLWNSWLLEFLTSWIIDFSSSWLFVVFCFGGPHQSLLVLHEVRVHGVEKSDEARFSRKNVLGQK